MSETPSSLAEQLRVEMVRLQRAQKPHESIDLLLHWLFLPEGDPRRDSALEFSKRHKMFDPDIDPCSTSHPDDDRFKVRLIVLEGSGVRLNVGVRINRIDGANVRFLQYPPLPPELQEILEARVAEIAFGGIATAEGDESP